MSKGKHQSLVSEEADVGRSMLGLRATSRVSALGSPCLKERLISQEMGVGGLHFPWREHTVILLSMS